MTTISNSVPAGDVLAENWAGEIGNLGPRNQTQPRQLEVVMKYLLSILVVGVIACPVAAETGFLAVADVVGPNGEFAVALISIGEDHAVMDTVRGSKTSRILVAGDTVWSGAKDALETTDPVWRQHVEGHNVHRMVVSSGVDKPETLVVEPPDALGGGEVVIRLGDWRRVADIELPFSADFQHGEDTWEYRYRQVLPFRAPMVGPVADDRESVLLWLTSIAQLAAQHSAVLQAHMDRDPEAVMAATSDPSLLSGRGRLSLVPKADMLSRLGTYLATTRFDEYADAVVPVISVSDDGTLGWVACEIAASGTRESGETAIPFEFAFSWVELYANTGGGWLMVGNASSQRQ
jgi:hypothetical protein